MKRKCYTFKELAIDIPELLSIEHQKIDKKQLEFVLSLVDEWASKNNLKLFQIFTPQSASIMFIFNVID